VPVRLVDHVKPRGEQGEKGSKRPPQDTSRYNKHDQSKQAGPSTPSRLPYVSYTQQKLLLQRQQFMTDENGSSNVTLSPNRSAIVTLPTAQIATVSTIPASAITTTAHTASPVMSTLSLHRSQAAVPVVSVRSRLNDEMRRINEVYSSLRYLGQDPFLASLHRLESAAKDEVGIFLAQNSILVDNFMSSATNTLAIGPNVLPGPPNVPTLTTTRWMWALPPQSATEGLGIRAETLPNRAVSSSLRIRVEQIQCRLPVPCPSSSSLIPLPSGLGTTRQESAYHPTHSRDSSGNFPAAGGSGSGNVWNRLERLLTWRSGPSAGGDGAGAELLKNL
jgi:hypothetical protein